MKKIDCGPHRRPSLRECVARPRGTTPPFAAFTSRVEIQINRLTDLISTRNAEEIGLLLDAELAEKELARYLAELPPEYGAVTSEIVTRPSHPEGLFEIVLITQQGSRFSALTGWQEQEGRLKLTFFALTPYQQQVPGDLRQSLETFVTRLRAAVREGDREGFSELLGPRVEEQRAWEFFWKFKPPPYGLGFNLRCLRAPLSITIAVPPHSPPGCSFWSMQALPPRQKRDG